MSAKNRVIAGDYNGMPITGGFGQVRLSVSTFKSIVLNSSTVETYEIITDEHRKSAASGVARGIVGGVLLGSVGMLAGALSAKEKATYHVAIQFKDGKKSLIEVDDKIYNGIVQACF